MELLKPFALIAFVVMIVRKLMQNSAVDARFALRSIAALVVFVAASFAGMALLWQVAETLRDSGGGVTDSPTPLLLTLSSVCWMGLCALWTMGKAPSLRVPPRWITERWGALDFFLIAGCGGGVILALLLN